MLKEPLLRGEVVRETQISNLEPNWDGPIRSVRKIQILNVMPRYAGVYCIAKRLLCTEILRFEIIPDYTGVRFDRFHCIILVTNNLSEINWYHTLLYSGNRS